MTLFFCLLCQKDDSEDALVRSCVGIVTESSMGSGMVLDRRADEIVIATAGHVIDDANVKVIFFDGVAVPGTVLNVDKTADIAYIGVKMTDMSGIDTLSKAMPVSKPDEGYYDEPDSLIKEDNTCIVFDSVGKNMRIRQSEGVISSLNEYVYDSDENMVFGRLNYLEEGMSGSPIFNKEGILLGMLLSGSDSGEFTGVSFVKLSY